LVFREVRPLWLRSRATSFERLENVSWERRWEERELRERFRRRRFSRPLKMLGEIRERELF